MECTGVTLVNKMIPVSGVQFNNTSSAFILGVHHPKSSLFPSPLIPPLSSSTSPFLLPFFPSPQMCEVLPFCSSFIQSIWWEIYFGHPPASRKCKLQGGLERQLLTVAYHSTEALLLKAISATTFFFFFFSCSSSF